MKNIVIQKGATINSQEFEDMSDALSSIDPDFQLSESQYKAIGYFAQLHDVSMCSVIGTECVPLLEAYEAKYFEELEKEFQEANEAGLDQYIKELEKQERIQELKRKNINIITAADLMTKKVN